MGAWDTGPFDNDSALDWVSELEESSGDRFLMDTFARTEEQIQRGDMEDGERAIAAGEAVAALMGRPVANLDPTVEKWVKGASRPTSELIATARRVVTLVLEHPTSNTRACWEGAEPADSRAWIASVRDLIVRLG